MITEKKKRKTRPREKMCTFSINIPARDVALLQIMAERSGMSVSAVMRRLIKDYLEEHLTVEKEAA